jgi:hypothetical protein
MAATEEHTCSPVNPAFPHDNNTVTGGMCTEKITAITLSYPAAGDLTLPSHSLQGSNGADIPEKKNERVDYPGRSVLYSRQFRPFTLDNQHKITQSWSDEP